MADKLVISMKEAAHRLGVSLAFLYDQRTAGKFPTIQLGKRRLVAVADLEAYLVGNRESAHVRKREENGATGKMGRQYTFSHRSDDRRNRTRLADGVRFELTVALPPRQFSRLEP